MFLDFWRMLEYLESCRKNLQSPNRNTLTWDRTQDLLANQEGPDHLHLEVLWKNFDEIQIIYKVSKVQTQLFRTPHTGQQKMGRNPWNTQTAGLAFQLLPFGQPSELIKNVCNNKEAIKGIIKSMYLSFYSITFDNKWKFAIPFVV